MRKDNQLVEWTKDLLGKELRDSLIVESCGVMLYLGDIISKDPLLTEYRIWVDCWWRVRNEQAVLGTKLDQLEDSRTALSMVHGSRIERVEFEPTSGDLVLYFSSAIRIELLANSVTDQQWEIICTDGRSLVLAAQRQLIQLRNRSDDIRFSVSTDPTKNENLLRFKPKK